METIKQQDVTDLEISESSFGNIVITQESDNEDATSIVIEPSSVPALIRLLKFYQLESRS